MESVMKKPAACNAPCKRCDECPYKDCNYNGKVEPQKHYKPRKGKEKSAEDLLLEDKLAQVEDMMLDMVKVLGRKAKYCTGYIRIEYKRKYLRRMIYRRGEQRAYARRKMAEYRARKAAGRGSCVAS